MIDSAHAQLESSWNSKFWLWEAADHSCYVMCFGAHPLSHWYSHLMTDDAKLWQPWWTPCWRRGLHWVHLKYIPQTGNASWSRVYQKAWHGQCIFVGRDPLLSDPCCDGYHSRCSHFSPPSTTGTWNVLELGFTGLWCMTNRYPVQFVFHLTVFSGDKQI